LDLLYPGFSLPLPSGPADCGRLGIDEAGGAAYVVLPNVLLLLLLLLLAGPDEKFWLNAL